LGSRLLCLQLLLLVDGFLHSIRIAMGMFHGAIGRLVEMIQHAIGILMRGVDRPISHLLGMVRQILRGWYMAP